MQQSDREIITQIIDNVLKVGLNYAKFPPHIQLNDEQFTYVRIFLNKRKYIFYRDSIDGIYHIVNLDPI